MSDLYWTVTATLTRDGLARQARALGRVASHPGIVDTRALGPCHLEGIAGDHAARSAAEVDGWASGLPCDPDYAPLTARPAPPAPLVMTAVPEPVLVPAPAPSRVLVAAPEPAPPPPDPDAENEPENEPDPAPRPRAKPLSRRTPPPRKGR